MSESSDDAQDDAPLGERERFEAETVADNPIAAFTDADTERAPPEERLGPDGTTSLSDVDVNPELQVLFWKLVLLYKVAIIGSTLGVLLLVFDRGPSVGLELLVGGVVLFVYALYATKRAKKRIGAGEFHDDSAGGTDTQGGEA